MEVIVALLHFSWYDFEQTNKILISLIILLPRTQCRACTKHGDVRNAYKVLVGKHKGKRSLTWSKYRWEDNIKTDLEEMGCEGVDWIYSAHDRVQYVNMVKNLRGP
jgi:hypothetical protein